jgi:hypothetical protein
LMDLGTISLASPASSCQKCRLSLSLSLSRTLVLKVREIYVCTLAAHFDPFSSYFFLRSNYWIS